VPFRAYGFDLQAELSLAPASAWRPPRPPNGEDGRRPHGRTHLVASQGWSKSSTASTSNGVPVAVGTPASFGTPRPRLPPTSAPLPTAPANAASGTSPRTPLSSVGTSRGAAAPAGISASFFMPPGR
jgi:hypothetical protein